MEERCGVDGDMVRYKEGWMGKIRVANPTFAVFEESDLCKYRYFYIYF